MLLIAWREGGSQRQLLVLVPRTDPLVQMRSALLRPYLPDDPAPLRGPRTHAQTSFLPSGARNHSLDMSNYHFVSVSF